MVTTEGRNPTSRRTTGPSGVLVLVIKMGDVQGKKIVVYMVNILTLKRVFWRVASLRILIIEKSLSTKKKNIWGHPYSISREEYSLRTVFFLYSHFYGKLSRRQMKTIPLINLYFLKVLLNFN